MKTEITGQSSEKNVFLATTANEDFWDISKPIIFLGDGCLRYSRKHFWEPLNGIVLKSPLVEANQRKEAYYYLRDVYDKILAELYGRLNEIHEVRFSKHYWKVIIGAWLLHYINIVYDRYAALSSALSQYPKLTTIVLSKESYHTPNNTFDFVTLATNNDNYNLQMYSRILDLLGKKFEGKKIKENEEEVGNGNGTRFSLQSIKRKIFPILSVYLYKLLKRRIKLLLVDPYFEKYFGLKLGLASLGKIYVFDMIRNRDKTNGYDFKKRALLAGNAEREDGFVSIVWKLIADDIPKCFVEGYEQNTLKAEEMFPKKQKAIFSAIGWYFNELFKFWAALESEKGAKLIGNQHGGNYGSLAYHPAEDFEISIADKWYSWGWSRKGYENKIVPFYAAKYIGTKKINADNKKEGILFFVVASSRYLYRIGQLTPYNFKEHLNWKIRFISAISAELGDKLKIRNFINDYGWDMMSEIKFRFPDIGTEEMSSPFYKSLKNCKITISDIPSSTFLDTLCANKPTVLFWDPGVFECHVEAGPYYDLLRNIGILHDTPEAAADKINSVYDNIEAWWNDPFRQETIKIFCDQFAKNSRNSTDEWKSELNRIIST